MTIVVGRKDEASVTETGERLVTLIDGVQVRDAKVHPDERGEICEIYNPAWGFSPDPLVYVYAASLWPGRIKGWVYHERQEDRMFVLAGLVKIVLFDMRVNSPTAGSINEFHFGERNRALLRVPALVAHAVQNVGMTEATFINMPTRPYDHSNPDKFRVPRARIPYSFDKGSGW